MSEPRDYWSIWAQEAARVGSPLYARLAAGIGGDETLKALAAHAQKGQPRANMILAAVHYLLLRGEGHDLARFYPTLGGRACADAEDPLPLFAAFVARHRAAIAHLIESRVTNTNEVGRSAVLHPGFRTVAAEAGPALDLIEIGPSAGLNLNWDRYGVRYARDGNVLAEIAPDAPLVIDCELRGAVLPPTGAAPAVASRLGLELNPVDLMVADNRDWLRALVWPEHVARLARLDAALALAVASPPPVRGGDALALLLDAVRAVPEGRPICVYHTIALYQFSAEMKQTLEDLLTVVGLRRTIWRLGFEMAPDMRYLLTLTRYRDGSIEPRVLAEAHPHGGWLEWLP